AILLAFPLFTDLAQAKSDPTYHLDFKQFGLLAIQDNGRRKPIDTFARQTLIQLSGRSSYTDKAGRAWSANDFLLAALLGTHDWKSEPMILISVGKLKTQLGLEPQRRRFTLEQLAKSNELQRISTEARALKRADKTLDRAQQEAIMVSDRLALFTHVLDDSVFLIVPSPKSENAAWMVPDPASMSGSFNEQQSAPALAALTKAMNAYASADAFNFSAGAHELRDDLRAISPSVYPTESKLELEYFYNHFDGFFWAIPLYGIAFVLLLIPELRKKKSALSVIGVFVAIAALLFHATGIVLRCFIAGRPPVTNMYESIIWVSFAVSFFGMLFFARYRTAIYLLAALPVTFTALLLVFQMPIAMPASIDPLVPVLRDNFWLTIHVLTITLSYAAFALAMGFGHILLFRYARHPRETRADAPMHFWLYRVLQLGVLLLAAGTILGGVWANYSWGRFWGWDPKETWALIALLCYITTLHGRLAGWWTQFGLVVASVVCFLAVLMAWYGVNFILGKGLHSYGFGIGGESYVATFVIADLLFVAFAVWRYRSSRAAKTAAPAEETVSA
ncbi:MAG: cytochrome c biogenesis protein CcsA, partial [Verrucomicrobiota bacterium]|nr:cytochrome c biogenesis protein CcsA [Verrucomicrobiota bacterium]